VVNPQLAGLVFECDELADLDPARRRLALRVLAAGVLNPDEVPDSVAELSDFIDGYGPLSAFMRDDLVTDVMVNGPDEVWIDRAGELVRTDLSFEDASELESLIARLFSSAGARVDVSRPVADACMPDGARLHAVLPPIAPAGPLLSIRRFPGVRFTFADLLGAEMMSGAQGELLAEAITARRTLVISGGTGSGKTTLLNALLSCIPSGERVVIVEEIPELRPSASNCVSLVTRPPNVEERGGVDLHSLVRAALRMRPDRIVVGEVRGPEALAALGAMATGHEGSMLTLHARSAVEAVDRLVTLALGARFAPSEESLRRHAARAIDLVVHLERRGGKRVIAEIIQPE
jgi:pilus assembly protein CpaF